MWQCRIGGEDSFRSQRFDSGEMASIGILGGWLTIRSVPPGVGRRLPRFPSKTRCLAATLFPHFLRAEMKRLVYRRAWRIRQVLFPDWLALVLKYGMKELLRTGQN